MGIEYLPGIMAGDKIELNEKDYNRPKRRLELFLPLMKDKLAQQAEKYNQDYNCSWLNKEAAISMTDHPDWEKDESVSEEQEKQWAKETGKDHSQWRNDKEKNPSNLTEIALTLSLQRLLPSNLMVVRSARYDDYNNGVDQLIINRDNGSVVCGIDEVIDRQGNLGPSKKEEKITRKMLQGGARVKYGACVKDGALHLESLKNIPAFYLSLDKKELASLCESLEEEDTTVSERALLTRLIDSLNEQIKVYKSLSLSQGLQSNLNIFQESLDNWSK